MKCEFQGFFSAAWLRKRFFGKALLKCDSVTLFHTPKYEYSVFESQAQTQNLNHTLIGRKILEIRRKCLFNDKNEYSMTVKKSSQQFLPIYKVM